MSNNSLDTAKKLLAQAKQLLVVQAATFDDMQFKPVEVKELKNYLDGPGRLDNVAQIQLVGNPKTIGNELSPQYFEALAIKFKSMDPQDLVRSIVKLRPDEFWGMKGKDFFVFWWD